MDKNCGILSFALKFDYWKKLHEKLENLNKVQSIKKHAE